MEQENDEILVKISDVCRACLSRTENMKSLLENNDETFLLLSKFAFVVNLEIQLGLNYPSYLCPICEEKVLNSYEFQRQCQKSNELVSEYFAVFEKQDTVSIETESEIISRNLNTSEVEVVQPLQNNTETREREYEEISNPSLTSPCHKIELNDGQKYQEDLGKCISELKEKYKTDCVCVFCEFRAASSTTLSDHVSRMHKEFENSWCSLCNKIFSNIEVHSEELHNHDFVCKFCQLQFSTFKLIIEHLHSHQVANETLPDMPELAIRENDSTCQVSSEKFDNPKLLKTHSETHSVCCEFCSETLSTTEENHKCSRARRKGHKDLEVLQVESDKLSTKGQECDVEKQGKTIIDTNAPIDIFKNFCPEEVPHGNEALQKMRLKQYSVKDVEKAINIAREKFYKQITCIFCKFSANTNRSLSVHVTRVHREYKGKWCSSCNKVIENQTRHHKDVHYEDFKCPFCKKIKSNMGHFMEHLASHCAERLHKCDICHKSFISKRHLRIHRDTHLKGRPHSCDICKKAFLQAKHLKAHLKTHPSGDKVKKEINDDSVEDTIEIESHENIENYNLNCSKIESAAKETEEMPSKPHNYCKDCNRKVRSLPSHYKNYHIKRDSVHSERKPNLCPHCGKRFSTRSKLTEHMRIHTGETPYKCQYCDKRVKTRNILVVHERTHTGEKPYLCTVCGKTFAQSSILNTHLRIHTGRPEQCTICEKRFCRPAELRLHMRKHTGEKPYICDQCGQGFKQKSHLVEHTRTHTEDRPYKCEHCKKAFKSSGILKSHLQIHTGQKPFKCSQCPYACRQPYSLTQHMVHHDNDRPQLDYPHTCQLCQKNYATTAHLTAHHTRFHSDRELKIENVQQPQPPVDNEVVITDHKEADLTDQHNYQTDSKFQNVDTVIIQTNSDVFEPIQIRFTAMQDV